MVWPRTVSYLSFVKLDHPEDRGCAVTFISEATQRSGLVILSFLFGGLHMEIVIGSGSPYACSCGFRSLVDLKFGREYLGGLFSSLWIYN